MRKNLRLLALSITCFTIALFSQHAMAEDGTAISKDGTKIAYSVYGKGEPTLVFIHGWSGNRAIWADQVPYFAKDHRVVTLDLGGHGASGRERKVYTMKAFGEDVAAVVDKVGATKAILIGHSMSGEVVFEAADMLKGKTIAIIGIDTMHDFAQKCTPEQKEARIKPLKEDFKKTTDSFIRGMFPKNANPKIVDKVAGSLSSASPEVGVSAMSELVSTPYTTLPKPTVSVWALNADLWPTNIEGNKKYISGFTVRIMPGYGHFLMLEAPDKFNDQLGEIIVEIEKTSR